MAGNDTETRLRVLEISQQQTNEAIITIKDSMVSLVRLEERHAETREALARAFEYQDDIDKRLQIVEQKLPGLIEARGWMVAGILGCMSLLGVAIVGLVLNTREDHASHGVYLAPPTAETRRQSDR